MGHTGIGFLSSSLELTMKRREEGRQTRAVHRETPLWRFCHLAAALICQDCLSKVPSSQNRLFEESLGEPGGLRSPVWWGWGEWAGDNGRWGRTETPWEKEENLFSLSPFDLLSNHS